MSIEPELLAPKIEYVEGDEMERARVALGRLILWVHRNTQLTSAEILDILKGSNGADSKGNAGTGDPEIPAPQDN